MKALELYAEAGKLYANQRSSDGEIGVLRNIGIARGTDLNDMPGALAAFTEALGKARATSNRRATVQALLYRGAILRRMGKLIEANRDEVEAAQLAESAKHAEEQWKALFELGRIAEAQADLGSADAHCAKAVTIIESLRSGLQQPLRTDFLADKRQAFDALISLRLKQRSSAGDLRLGSRHVRPAFSPASSYFKLFPAFDFLRPFR